MNAHHPDILRTAVGALSPGERVIFRGRVLHQDMRDWSWLKLWAFSITGRELADPALKLLNAMWVYTSFPDVRLWNNRVAALASSARSTPISALAASVAVEESYVFGAGPELECSRFLVRALAQEARGLSLQDIIDAEIRDNGRVAGYGRPLTAQDERMQPLLAAARAQALDQGPHLALMNRLAQAFESRKNALKPNYAALICALGADLGFSAEQFVLFLGLLLTAGTPPCQLEWAEQPENAFMRTALSQVNYVGPEERNWSDDSEC